MTKAAKSEEFNLVGSWSKNSVYIACNWSWADAEGMEEELVEDINSTFVSPDFLIAWRSTGTGEPVPLSLLTIDQLVEVVNTNPVNEKKAIMISAEDKEVFERLEEEARNKSKENSPNSTGNLVDWIFAKIVVAVARGTIRFVTAMESRGTRFFLLPKRNIWMKKGGRVEEATKQAELEREEREAQKRQADYDAGNAAKKQKQAEQDEEGELVGADRERSKLLIEDSDEDEIKDFWGLQEKKEQAAGKGQLEKEKLNAEVSE